MNNEIQVAVDVVRNDDDEYLLAKRTKDSKWEFVGGKVEEDENLDEAALRELKEETGLKGEILKVNGSYPSPVDSKYILCPVLIESNSKDVALGEEHSQYEWIELSELDGFDTAGQSRALELLNLK